jgi:hypothetical protein
MPGLFLRSHGFTISPLQHFFYMVRVMGSVKIMVMGKKKKSPVIVGTGQLWDRFAERMATR